MKQPKTFDHAGFATFSEMGLREFIAHCPAPDELSPAYHWIGADRFAFTHADRAAAIEELRKKVQARMGAKP